MFREMTPSPQYKETPQPLPEKQHEKVVGDYFATPPGKREQYIQELATVNSKIDALLAEISNINKSLFGSVMATLSRREQAINNELNKLYKERDQINHRHLH